MDDIELMRCPKCGGEMKIRLWEDGYQGQFYEAVCSECGLRSKADTLKRIVLDWSVDSSQNDVFVGRITPTREHLPDAGVYVLACSKNFEGGWYVLCVDEDGCWYDEDIDHWTNTRDVTAWIPLPKPYEEG